ncbi:MAG: hypothetical protein ACKOCN_06510 [Planctomycetaceae bacterium]
MSETASDQSSQLESGRQSPQRGSAHVVHEIHWSDAFPWWNLFAAAGRAFSPAVLLLATAGFVSVWAGWSVVDRLIEIDGCECGSPAMSLSPPSREAFPMSTKLIDALPTFVIEWCGTILTPFNPSASLGEAATALVRIGWFVIVWSIFGTAISRYVALRSVGEESRGLFGSFAYGLAKWPAAFNGAAVVLLGVMLLAVPGMLLGLLMRFDWGLAVVATVWPVVLAGGLIVAILALGLVAGWPLMVACIGVERGDSFQAISSAFSYVFQRPLHYAFYLAVAVVVFVPSLFAAAAIVDATNGLSVWAASWGMGHDRTSDVLEGLSRIAMGGVDAGGIDRPAGESASAAWGTSMLDFWRRCLTAMLGAFVWAYVWSVVTAIYVLLRRDVDGTELDEVVLNELPGEA